MRIECAVFGGLLIPLCFLFDTMKPRAGVHQQGRVRSYRELLKDRVVICMCVSFMTGSFGCKSFKMWLMQVLSGIYPKIR